MLPLCTVLNTGIVVAREDMGHWYLRAPQPTSEERQQHHQVQLKRLLEIFLNKDKAIQGD